MCVVKVKEIIHEIMSRRFQQSCDILLITLSRHVSRENTKRTRARST